MDFIDQGVFSNMHSLLSDHPHHPHQLAAGQLHQLGSGSHAVLPGHQFSPNTSQSDTFSVMEVASLAVSCTSSVSQRHTDTT